MRKKTGRSPRGAVRNHTAERRVSTRVIQQRHLVTCSTRLWRRQNEAVLRKEEHADLTLVTQVHAALIVRAKSQPPRIPLQNKSAPSSSDDVPCSVGGCEDDVRCERMTG